MHTKTSVNVGRVLLLTVSIGTIAWVLGVVVFGTVDLISQLITHTIRPTMYWTTDYFQFTDLGDGQSGVMISGKGGPVLTSVTGVTPATTAIHIAATVVRLVIQLALGCLALMLIERLRAGQPFGNAAWRLVAALSGGVLALGLAHQLLAWWSRVAIINDAGGGTFSKEFAFEPLTITIGLSLALVALAFRVGERLQRETEGLI